jgi:CheY-like chemotaxis protein
MNQPLSLVPAVVLVAEDEVLVRMFAADLLDEAGFRVIEAGHANEALLLLQARPDVQVLVTDVEMTGGSIDGFELARQVRKRWPRIAIIVVSGRQTPGPGDLPEGVEFIAKPYRPTALLQAIQASVDRSS